MIECALLGPIQVTMDGGPAPRALQWKKNLALLAYLACAPRRTRGRQHLTDLLWGDRDESRARHSLNEAARVLRRALGEDAVIGTGDEIGLRQGTLTLDLDRFTELSARRAWAEAAAVIRGDFLEDFSVPDAASFDDWITAERIVWRRRSLHVLGQASALERDRGNLAAALEYAGRAAALDPLSDRAAQELMRVQALGGDREAALATYAAFARRLQDGAGVEPEAETASLARAVRSEPRRQRPVPARSPAAPPLTGREAELAALVGAWNAMRTLSRAGVVVVQGSGGLGRTRLLEELKARARLDGAFIAASRAVAGDEASPGRSLLALAATFLDAPGVAGADPAAHAALAATEPAWAERFRPRSENPLPIAAAARALIDAVAEEVPVLLALDDAHHADAASLEALEQLLRDLSARPVLLALTAFDHPARSAIEQLAARAGRDVPGVSLRLEPLPTPAVARLAGLMLPGMTEENRERLVRRVMHDSGGIPLLAEALLQAVRSGLELELDAAAWPAPSRTLTATLPGPLPDAVAAAIRLVFRELGTDAQRVGAAAAALGQRVTLQELAAATELGAPAVEQALDELERRGWVLWDARGYSFAAHLTEEVVARDLLTPGQRRRIADRAGRTGPPSRPPA